LPYDDTLVQAKQSEITTIFQQMQQSMVDRVVRLLSAPDVGEAIQNVQALPTDDAPVDLEPVSNDPAVRGGNQWVTPTVQPGGVFGQAGNGTTSRPRQPVAAAAEGTCTAGTPVRHQRRRKPAGH